VLELARRHPPFAATLLSQPLISSESPHIACAHAGYRLDVPRPPCRFDPTGKSPRNPSKPFRKNQAPSEKIFRFAVYPNQFYESRRPAPEDGRIAIVTDVGCGMRWTRVARETNALLPPSLEFRRTGASPGEAFGVDGSRTAKPCGPDAPTLASSWRRCFASRRRRWQESPVAGESAE